MVDAELVKHQPLLKLKITLLQVSVNAILVTAVLLARPMKPASVVKIANAVDSVKLVEMLNLLNQLMKLLKKQPQNLSPFYKGLIIKSLSQSRAELTLLMILPFSN